jgi:hypothetical protein
VGCTVGITVAFTIALPTPVGAGVGTLRVDGDSSFDEELFKSRSFTDANSLYRALTNPSPSSITAICLKTNVTENWG